MGADVWEDKPWILLALSVLGFLAAVWVFDRIMEAVARRPRSVDAPDTDRTKAMRRGTSGAAFALQQVFDPGIEHVIRAERDAEAEDADPDGHGDLPDSPLDLIRIDLLTALARVPIQPEEIRGALAEARREGLDWRALYDAAVCETLANRPYLAPTMPQASRVAPRQLD